VNTCHPSYVEKYKYSPGQPSITRDPISKTTKAKRTGQVVHEVEHLPSKSEALRSASKYHQKKDVLCNFHEFSHFAVCACVCVCVHVCVLLIFCPGHLNHDPILDFPL
jgi:hypothetical protein